MTVRHWLDSNGNRATAADWSGDLVPLRTDDAVIDTAGSYVSENPASTARINVNSITISGAGVVLGITNVAGNHIGSGGVSNSDTFGLHSDTVLTVDGKTREARDVTH